MERNLAGELADDDFRPLRLQNGWYVQRHAPMLRVAIPYGELSSKQLRQLGRMATELDRGFLHFTTRQNAQFNWIPLEKSADAMDLLAEVDMHGIQTSGNCIRNITSDVFAGIAPDELIDPRPYCELLRQWSTLQPEFAFLPRKFKIAVSGATEDRAAIAWHDIGLQLLKNDAGEVGFKVLVGGGMGRTPVIGSVATEFLPWNQILVYIEAIVRVYKPLRPPRQRVQGAHQDPREGRRPEVLRPGQRGIPQDPRRRQRRPRAPGAAGRVRPHRRQLHASPRRCTRPSAASTPTAPAPRPVPFLRWLDRNVHGHQIEGYRAVTLSLKRPGPAARRRHVRPDGSGGDDVRPLFAG